MFHRQRQDVIQRDNPILHVALIHGWAPVGKKNVASRNGIFVRKINYQIAHGVGHGLPDLNLMAADVESKVARPRRFIQRIIGRLLCLLSGICRTDHHRIRPNNRVSTTMVEYGNEC